MTLPARFMSWLNINRACNLRCEWCYAGMMDFGRSENMTLDVVQRSIDFMKGLPVKEVILIGGEPTIHPQFLQIVRMLKEAGFRPLVVTNGIEFANREFLEAAIEAGVNNVTTSLKAANEEDYERFTGKKMFSTVMTAIKNLNETGIPHKVCVTVCEDVIEGFDGIIDALIESKPPLFSFDMGRPVIVNGQVQGDGIALPKTMAEFVIKIYPKLLASGITFNIKMLIPFCLFPRSFIETLIKNDHLSSACQIFEGTGIIIDPKGRLLPCNHFCDNPLGQIGIDFSTADEYVQFRLRSDIADFYKTMGSCPAQECVDCKYWQYCGGGCRIHWLRYGADEMIGSFSEERR